MNKEETLKAIEVMQAWVEGKEIQFLSQGCWVEFKEGDQPVWDWVYTSYRIKPKPANKPSINWEHVHPDYKWMATDADGTTYLYEEEPTVEGLKWQSGAGWCRVDRIFASFIPGDCDWKESLVQRPEAA